MSTTPPYALPGRPCGLRATGGTHGTRARPMVTTEHLSSHQCLTAIRTRLGLVPHCATVVISERVYRSILRGERCFSCACRIIGDTYALFKRSDDDGSMVGPPIMKDLSSGANERPRQVLQKDVRKQVVCSTGSRGFGAVSQASTAGSSAAPDKRVVLLAVVTTRGRCLLVLSR